MQRSTLRIGASLRLPLDGVTQTFSVLAKRGVGKTYTALVLVEEMLKAGLRVVVVDPIGVCWGLRAAADGKREGLPITIFGGDRGDVPLEAAAGTTIADLVVEEQLSIVLDLSLFRKGEQTRFMTDFAERLYHRNREPLHLVLDEADFFAPQRPMPGQQRLLGAIEDLVRRGRARGLGVTLVTQRAAVLNKDVLTQTEVLVALRTIAPQDRAAIDAWIKVHGTEEERAQLMGSLPSLPVGTAWFWSPGWLDVFQRVKVRRRETFDSSATPTVRGKLIEPKRLAPVDLARLKDRIAATIERAKQEDPRELRRRIAELEAELQRAHSDRPEPERVTVPIITDGNRRALEALAKVFDKARTRGEEAALAVLERLQAIAAAANATTPSPHTRRQSAPSTTPGRTTAIRRASTSRAGNNSDLTGPEQRILDALAWLAGVRQVEPEQSAVAFLAGYTVGGGAFNNPRGALRTKGLIEYRGDRLTLTEAGWARAQAPPTLLTSEDLQRRVLERLPGPERKLLRELIDVYPESLSYDDLAERAGYAPGGGAFNNPRGRLRTLGLVEYPERGRVAARSVLFLE